MSEENLGSNLPTIEIDLVDQRLQSLVWLLSFRVSMWFSPEKHWRSSIIQSDWIRRWLWFGTCVVVVQMFIKFTSFMATSREDRKKTSMKKTLLTDLMNIWTTTTHVPNQSHLLIQSDWMIEERQCFSGENHIETRKESSQTMFKSFRLILCTKKMKYSEWSIWIKVYNIFTSKNKYHRRDIHGSASCTHDIFESQTSQTSCLQLLPICVSSYW